MASNDHNPWEQGAPNHQTSVKPAPGSTVPRKNVMDIQLQRILSVWPFMILSALVFFGLAWMYLRYAVNIYEASTSVVLENNTDVSLGQALFSTRDPLNNQIALLKSPAVTKRVVDKYRLQYHAFLKGQVKDKELFQDLKWWVSIPSGNAGALSFEIRPSGNGFTWTSGGLHGSGQWGKAVMIKGNEVRVEKNMPLEKDAVIECYEIDPRAEADKISTGLDIAVSKESNVIKIKLRDNIPQRAVAVLEELVVAYNEEARIAKSRSLQQSLDFIQQRLSPVTYELDSIETAMANYKSSKGFVGNNTKGNIYMGQSLDYEAKLKEVQLQKALLAQAETYLTNPKTGEKSIAVPGIDDPALTNSISKFHELRAERERLSRSLTENNPRLQQLDNAVQDARNNIDVQFGNYRNNIRLLENNLVSNLSRTEGMVRSTPTDEKTMLEQSRMQNIKQSLFLLLLQKREEAAINLASVSVQTSVLAPASLAEQPVSPRRNEIMIGSFLFGLFLPLGFAGIREVMNNKISSKMQLQQMTTVPVISEVDEAFKLDSGLVVKTKDRSVFGEQIRSLRTNLNFYAAGKKPFYILLTSSMSGEGKSFVGANLAASFALIGKKTALLEFDLRKPKLADRFGIKKGRGIVNVLMGEEDPAKIGVKVMENHPLFLYQTGPIPPNPSELMEMKGMDLLKKHLDQNYDVVIIDTPPYALVADAQILEKWSDVNLFVVRFRKTLRDQVHEIEEAKQSQLFKNMAIVFNGIQTSGYYGYRYGYYGAKRKYGYSYYHKEDKA